MANEQSVILNYNNPIEFSWLQVSSPHEWECTANNEKSISCNTMHNSEKQKNCALYAHQTALYSAERLNASVWSITINDRPYSPTLSKAWTKGVSKTMNQQQLYEPQITSEESLTHTKKLPKCLPPHSNCLPSQSHA